MNKVIGATTVNDLSQKMSRFSEEQSGIINAKNLMFVSLDGLTTQQLQAEHPRHDDIVVIMENLRTREVSRN